jgi:hypothetical protein
MVRLAAMAEAQTVAAAAPRMDSAWGVARKLCRSRKQPHTRRLRRGTIEPLTEFSSDTLSKDGTQAKGGPASAQTARRVVERFGEMIGARLCEMKTR